MRSWNDQDHRITKNMDHWSELHLGALPIMTWSDENLHLRNNDMQNRDLIASVRSRCDLNRWSNSISKFHKSRLGEARNITTGVPKCGNTELRNTLRFVVSAGGYTIEELKRRVRADKILFGVLGIATWRVKMPHLQIHEMKNRESALCISAWSLHVVMWRKDLVQISSASEFQGSCLVVSRHRIIRMLK